MRFCVRVDEVDRWDDRGQVVGKTWAVTVTCPDLGDAWRCGPRVLRRLPVERTALDQRPLFPLPPEGDLPPPGDPHYALCAATEYEVLEMANSQIHRRPPAPDAAVAFGRYLWHTLLGPAIWQEILNAAADTDLLELALIWPATQADLHRLNWELMHAGRNFLAASYPRKIAITRVVPVKHDAANPRALREAHVPPRLLFVVGTDLEDTEIQPGAEVLGLLRQLEDRRRLGAHARILQRARPRLIALANSSFRPDVVHFICHGATDRQGGFLELVSDEQGKESFHADRLYNECLQTAQALPIVVVLSACDSGTILGVHDMGPLAAQLIALGIPIVVGMAGRIADRACRYFTRRFGQALAEGESLAAAAAQGRWTAFAKTDPPYASVDWAFPALFMADDVPPGYVPVARAAGDQSLALEDKFCSKYGIERAPLFCGRDDFFDAYYDMFEPGPDDRPPRKTLPRVLMAYAQQPERDPKRPSDALPQIGRSRLLKELALQAYRDGHVPVLWTPPDQAVQWPKTSLQLATLIVAQSVRAVREVFCPDQGPVTSQVQKLSRYRDKPDDLSDDVGIFDDIKDQYASDRDVRNTGISEVVVALALRHDLNTLLADARSKYPNLKQVVVFLDKVELYDNAIDALFGKILLDNPFVGMLDDYGLGTQEAPIPVVMNCLMVPPASTKLEALLPANKDWLRMLELKPFQPGEDMRVYQQVLLHPFGLPSWEGIADKPWIRNLAARPDVASRSEARFRDRLRGYPSALSNGKLFDYAQIAVDDGFLVLADDEALLLQLKNDAVEVQP